MKFLRACSKVIAACLAIAFVISALIALILFNIQGKLLKSETYKDALEQQGIYERLPSLVTKQIATSMTYNPCRENPEQCEGEDQVQGPAEDENGGPPSYLKNLSEEQWEQILSQILTPEWTKSQTESALDQLFAFLDSGEDTLSIKISLVDLKANLTGEKGMDIILELVYAQPPCTEQLLNTLFDIAAGEFTPDELLVCAPPEDILEDLAPEMEAALERVVEEIPDEATIGQDLFGGNEDQGLQGPIENREINFQTIRLALRFSPFLPLLFLVLYTLFGVRSLKDFLLWWGIPFLALSLAALGIGLIAFPIINWGLETFVLSRIPGAIDPSFIDILIDTAELLVQSLVRVIATQAVVIGILGLIMTGAGIFVSYSSSKAQSV